MKNKGEVLGLLGLAQSYVKNGDVERAEECCDDAILLMHGMKPWGGLTLRQLNNACNAFLKETGFPTLAVAITYTKYYRKRIEELTGGHTDPQDPALEALYRGFEGGDRLRSGEATPEELVNELQENPLRQREDEETNEPA